MSQESPGSGFRLRIEFAQASDPGRDPNKQVNEDACGYAETRFGHLCVLCDGMGGHYGGKEASRTAISTIFEVVEQLPPGLAPAQALKQSIEEAGRRVYLLGGPPENRTRPGSTVVAMLLHDRGLDVAHVGDSRAYIIRSNQIYPLTRDHSMVQGMIDAGMLTEESAMGHPDSNKITRALGMKPDVDVELRPDTMELFAGDVLTQSSDGLTDLALGRDILAATRQALASGGVEHACNTLVKLANDRGGHDNITVQMVRVVDVGAAHHGITAATIPDRAGAPYAGAQGAGPTPPAGPAPFAVGAPQQAGAASQQAPGVAVDTVQMTSPAMAAANPSYVGRSGQAPQSGPSHQGLRPLMPTAPDATPAPSFGAPPPVVGAMGGAPGGVVPTLTMQSQYPPSQPQQQAPGLATYRLDGGAAAAGALPLPPPSGRLHGPQGGQPAQGPYGVGGGAPMMSGFGAPTPTPGAIQTPMGGPLPAQASKGGLVFLIIGMSAVIAVLILVIVWALLLR